MSPRSDPSSLVNVLISALLLQYNVELAFLDEVIDNDLPSYDKGMVKKILAEISKKAKSPHLMPKGSIEPLHGDLSGCGKIRMLSDMIRIVVRTTQRENLPTLLEVLAIGPKAKEEAYAVATMRYNRIKNK
jgi:mRNA interferase RelE/StbE